MLGRAGAALREEVERGMVVVWQRGAAWVEAGREKGEQVEKGWEGGNCAAAAVAVYSPPLLEMGEGRGEREVEEEEEMARKRLGERGKEMEEKGVQEVTPTETLKHGVQLRKEGGINIPYDFNT